LAGLLAAGLAAPAPAQQAQEETPAVPVEAAKVEIRPILERVIAVGSLRSNESVTMRPEIAGRVVSIDFDEGQAVEKGRLLLKLDDSVYQAELNEAEAQLRLAQSNFQRVEELHTKKVATARSRDEARSGLDVGTAAVALAQARLERTRIIAPFAGIAGLRQVSIGDYITAGQDIVNLEDIDPIKVDFRVAEKFLSAVRVGQTIQVGVDAYPGTVFEGEVYAIDPRIDIQGRSVVIRARLPNSERLLRPGLFARVTLVLETRPQAVTVPEQAIMPRGSEQFVFTIVDGKVKQTKVTIGSRRDGRVEIVEGLGHEDIVVTAGHLKIRDGVAVRVIGDGKGA
jgi:membrane fusion protein (multidrug efflux system)